MKKRNLEFAWNDRVSSAVRVVRVSEPTRAVKIATPELAAKYWRTTVAREPWFDHDKEHLVTFILSTKYTIKGHSLVSIGTISETLAGTREIFRAAIASAASAIVVLHNHPSGDPAPSHADYNLTMNLQLAAEMLNIKMLDHVIVGKGTSYFSFKEAGVLDWAADKVLCRLVTALRRVKKFNAEG